MSCNSRSIRFPKNFSKYVYSLIRMICLWWHYIGKSISNIFGKSTIAYIRFRCRRLHHMCVAIHFVLIWLSREWIRRCFSILWDTRISVLRWILILMLNFRMHRKIFKKQLIHNDLMKMREKWLNASIYLNPQFLTCRFPMADLPLVQTWNLPKFLPKLMTKICKDMPQYARISEKWRNVKRLEKPENTGNMRKIKILFICHGSIFRKRWKPWIYRMFWTLREHFTKNLLKQKISKKSLARI